MIDYIAMFRALPEVCAIYRDGERLWVFTSNTRYSDELMDVLLDIEGQAIDCADYEYIDFRYVPDVLVEDHLDVVGDAEVLYLPELIDD